MVLCGNICSSGFYSDGFHVRGAEWREKKKEKKACHGQTFSPGSENSKVLATQSLRPGNMFWFFGFFVFLVCLFWFFFCKDLKKESPLCCYLLYLQFRSVDLCNVNRGF